MWRHAPHGAISFTQAGFFHKFLLSLLFSFLPLLLSIFCCSRDCQSCPDRMIYCLFCESDVRAGPPTSDHGDRLRGILTEHEVFSSHAASISIVSFSHFSPSRACVDLARSAVSTAASLCGSRTPGCTRRPTSSPCVLPLVLPQKRLSRPRLLQWFILSIFDILINSLLRLPTHLQHFTIANLQVNLLPPSPPPHSSRFTQCLLQSLAARTLAAHSPSGGLPPAHPLDLVRSLPPPAPQGSPKTTTVANQPPSYLFSLQ